MGMNTYTTKFKTVMVTVYIVLFLCCIGLPFSFLAFGSDLQTRQSTLYPFRSMIEVQEDFLTGLNTSGNIGSLSFSGAGTNSFQASVADRLGIFRITTTAVAATTARINMASGNAIDPALPTALTWIARLNTNDANTTTRIGSIEPVTASPPTNGIYLEKLDADTNWFCVTRSGGVQTRTDSGVAITTNFTVFSYNRNSSGVTFQIDYTSVCGTHSTNIPTTFINPIVFIINSAAADKTLDIDYFQMQISGISR